MDFVTGAAILSTLVGGTAVVAIPALDTSCERTVEMRQDGLVEVVTCKNGTKTVRPTQLIMKAKPGTGGLVLRDEKGNDLGSGIGENQMFIFTECGPEGSGLIHVFQVDSADDEGVTGGWGPLYTGYVKKVHTQNPSIFPCK
jgi:hypothetical protein